MKSRLIIFFCLFVLLAGLIGGFRYYLETQVPTADPNHIKELAPEVDPETGAAPGTPPA